MSAQPEQQQQQQLRPSGLENTLLSIFEPGVSSVTYLILYIAVFCLISVLLGYIVTGNGNIHIYVLLTLAIGLVASLQWYSIVSRNSSNTALNNTTDKQLTDDLKQSYNPIESNSDSDDDIDVDSVAAHRDSLNTTSDGDDIESDEDIRVRQYNQSVIHSSYGNKLNEKGNNHISTDEISDGSARQHSAELGTHNSINALHGTGMTRSPTMINRRKSRRDQ